MRNNDSAAELPARRRRRTPVLVAAVLATGLLTPFTLAAHASALSCGTVPTPLAAFPTAAPPVSTWTGSWGAAMGSGGTSASSGVTGQQTLRMVVHTSIGGATTRIHLVNTFSPDPVTIGHVTIAAQSSGSSAAAAPVGLTFAGSQQTVIPPGGDVYSDAVSFPVSGDENLLVSLWLPNGVTTAPFHSYTLTTSYTSAPGDRADHALDQAGTNFPSVFGQWAYLSGLDVTAAGSGGTVVAIGDSQVDGGHTTANTNSRWTDDYGRLLRTGTTPMGIVNKGISGNRLLTDGSGTRLSYGQSALARFDRDVLSQSGVQRVILYEGINDITMDGASDTAIETGIQQLAARAHAAGIKLSVATIPAYQGYSNWTAAGDQTRQCVNTYIRTTKDTDGFYDLDQTLRDPLNPSALFAGYYNRGDDHLHHNDNGAQALADTIAPEHAPTGLTLNYSQTTAGTLHGNGISDLLARNNSNGHLYEWPGYGDGTFGSPIDLTSGWNYTQTTAGNFHGTGKDDLVAADSTGNLYLWAGNGDGTFGAKTLLTTGWGSYSQTLAGDFRGTGHADLVARQDSTGNLYLWAGNGDGTFGAKTLLTTGWGSYSQTVAGTFYGTGLAHLLARNDSTGVLNEWVDTGGASFSRPLRITNGW